MHDCADITIVILRQLQDKFGQKCRWQSRLQAISTKMDRSAYYFVTTHPQSAKYSIDIVRLPRRVGESVRVAQMMVVPAFIATADPRRGRFLARRTQFDHRLDMAGDALFAAQTGITGMGLKSTNAWLLAPLGATARYGCAAAPVGLGPAVTIADAGRAGVGR